MAWHLKNKDASASCPRVALSRLMIVLKEAVPDVRLFRFGPTMCGFIQLDKKHVAQPKQAILAAFANDLYLKYVVCFDTDIDISKGSEIAWALLTRVQADRGTS